MAPSGAITVTINNKGTCSPCTATWQRMKQFKYRYTAHVTHPLILKVQSDQTWQKVWTDGETETAMQTSQQGKQCTREGVGTGSLGLVTTLALLLIWRDRVDRQVDRQTRQKWQGLVSDSHCLRSCCAGKSEVACSRVGSQSISMYIRYESDPAQFDTPASVWRAEANKPLIKLTHSKWLACRGCDK